MSSEIDWDAQAGLGHIEIIDNVIRENSSLINAWGYNTNVKLISWRIARYISLDYLAYVYSISILFHNALIEIQIT